MWSIGADLGETGSHNFFIWNHERFTNSLNGAAITIDDQNNVGLDGNPQSGHKLFVNGSVNSATNAGINSIRCRTNDASEVSLLCANSLWGYALQIDASGTGHIISGINPAITIAQDGAVGIGFNPNAVSAPPHDANYKLYVGGSIAAREIKVTAGNFPDYVFANDYPLMSISELKKFIDKNKHLPEVPSALEVEENDGFEMGKMQTVLLKKLEEQTLYIIDLQRQIDELKRELQK
jgi:hypothetical protein